MAATRLQYVTQLDPELDSELKRITRLGNEAVLIEQDRNRQLGITNHYSKDGIIYSDADERPAERSSGFWDSLKKRLHRNKKVA
ncbi:hypothetical protein LCGC14_2022480 [marine sediment metagenome]|uniref:Uncharacterized protein n=1 Tax=marine sediment metagenome TaxID=412755 RepID=A0A0F9EX79_9ZZZZ